MTPTASISDAPALMRAGAEPNVTLAASGGSREIVLAGLGTFQLDIFTDFATAEADWRHLEERAEGHPFQRYDWLYSWHAMIGRPRGVEPVIVVLSDLAGIPCLLLPLGIERGRLVSRLTALGDPVCDYHGPLITREFAERLTGAALDSFWAAFLNAVPPIDLVMLTSQPPRLGAVANPLHGLARHTYSAGAHAVRLGTDWETFYAERRSADTRRRYRRKERNLGKLGAVSFEHVTDPTECERLATDCLALKAQRLDQREAMRNPFAQHETRDFYIARATASAGRGELHLFRLNAGEEVVALALCLLGGSTLYSVVTVPLEAYHRYSPGMLLRHRLMAWAIEHGCTRFDLTVGDEGYKAEWCDETWEMRYGVWPRTVKGAVAAAGFRMAIDLKRWIKSRPGLFDAARRARALVARHRSGR